MEISVEKWLGMKDVVITVVDIAAAGIQDGQRRRLEQSAVLSTRSAEAVVVKYEMVPMGQGGDDALARIEAVLAMRDVEEFAEIASGELQIVFGEQKDNVQVRKGLLVNRTISATAEPVVASSFDGLKYSSPDNFFVTIAILAGFCVGAVFSGACCLAVLALRSKGHESVNMSPRCNTLGPATASNKTEEVTSQENAQLGLVELDSVLVIDVDKYVGS